MATLGQNAEGDVCVCWLIVCGTDGKLYKLERFTALLAHHCIAIKRSAHRCSITVSIHSLSKPHLKRRLAEQAVLPTHFLAEKHDATV